MIPLLSALKVFTLGDTFKKVLKSRWRIITIGLLIVLILFMRNQNNKLETLLSTEIEIRSDLEVQVLSLQSTLQLRSEETKAQAAKFVDLESRSKQLGDLLVRERKLSRQEVQRVLNTATPATSLEAVELLRLALDIPKIKEFD